MGPINNRPAGLQPAPQLPAEDGDIRGIQFDGPAGAERFALALADRQVSLAGFFDELPTVEAGALGLAVVKDAHLFAEAVIPVFAVELEIVGGVLALVHLREVVFGDAQIFERELDRKSTRLNSSHL